MKKAASLWLIAAAIVSAAPAPADIEFFEANVRPLLVQHCHSCHSRGKAAFAGLKLDNGADALKGSDAGPVIVPFKPAESKLIRAVRGETKQKMPPTGPLKAAEIAALVRWVELGAPWPEEKAPSPAGFDIGQRKKEHWAWQPVRPVALPAVRDARWPRQPIDHFVLARLEAKGLQPAGPADKRTLIRRVTFDLHGLPPTQAEIAAFEADGSPQAFERLVERLLSSPRYGERMARRWMDLVRYSESHGSEGDPDTPETWRYRDYLIRAFNDDVPYDQLIREHLAGDLLPQPRINAKEKLNESVLGAAHLRMVEHGFQPVDPWEDRVKWMDNQIDVFSKAFQGLTISCARCHDHKFDAISQKDFYALFGVFAGARPTQVAVDDPAHLDRNRERLARLKSESRAKLAEVWRTAAAGFAARLTGDKIDLEGTDDVHHRESPLHAWYALRGKKGEELQRGWRDLAGYWAKEVADRKAFNAANFRTAWDLAGGDYSKWLRHGSGAPAQPSPAGEFMVETEGDQVVRSIYPAGVYSGLLSSKHNAVIQSPRFKVESDSLSLRMLGGDLSFAQLIIENYSVPRGGIYDLRFSPKKDQMGWASWDLTFWKGFTAYLEFATAGDVTHFMLDNEDARKRPRPVLRADGRSHFGAQRVLFHNNKLRPKEEIFPILYLLEGAEPDSPENLAAHFSARLESAVEAWRTSNMDDRQAAFLDYFVRKGLLPNSMGRDEIRPLMAEYRKLEAEVPSPRRAPGVLDESAPDQALLVRGNHKNLGETVPRHYLTALEGRTYDDARLVRLRLAEEIANPRNPLTARVMVNRLWRATFRRGIVRTVDNFGKLGDPPTHPELLDWLAGRFVEERWSLKKMVRILVTSQTYQMGSQVSAQARQADPNNELLHHLPLRRLEAEEIRDAVLSLSGELDPQMYGRSVDVYYAHDKGQTKGDRDKGPLDGNGRRSIYLEIRRNATNPFLEAFDVPKPSITRGERDVTNVPLQSLAMLNSAFIVDQATKWARRMTGTREQRISQIFEQTLGRQPSPQERDQSETFLADLMAQHNATPEDPRVWRDFAHGVMNLKEFLYLR